VHRRAIVKSAMVNKLPSKTVSTGLIQRFAKEGLSERMIVNKLAARGINTSRSTVHRQLHSLQAASYICLRNVCTKVDASSKIVSSGTW